MSECDVCHEPIWFWQKHHSTFIDHSHIDLSVFIEEEGPKTFITKYNYHDKCKQFGTKLDE